MRLYINHVAKQILRPIEHSKETTSGNTNMIRCMQKNQAPSSPHVRPQVQKFISS